MFESAVTKKGTLFFEFNISNKVYLQSECNNHILLLLLVILKQTCQLLTNKFKHHIDIFLFIFLFNDSGGMYAFKCLIQIF